MRLAQILHLLKHEPLLCGNDYRFTLLDLFHEHATLDEKEFRHRRTGKATSGSELEVDQMEVSGSLAIIPIGGPIGQGLGEFEKGAGAVDVDDVAAELMEAESMDEVANIVLDFDSPGGMVQGTPELAQRIAAVEKPVYAWSRGTMCSAAYWLAAATRGIFTTPTAVVGNIGVSMVLQDLSKAAELAGVRVRVFSSGPYKGMGTPGTSLTQEQEVFLRQRVMQLAEDFYQHITTERPSIQPEHMQGQFYSGAEAVRLGFVDEVFNSFDDLRQYLE